MEGPPLLPKCLHLELKAGMSKSALAPSFSVVDVMDILYASV